MANPALERGVRKVGRDIFQAGLAVVAAGGATALIDLIVGHVNPTYGVVLAVFFKFLVTYAQNYLETKGKIPALLPSPGLVTTAVGGAVGKVVGTVDTVTGTAVSKTVGDTVESSTQVVGQVLDTTGQLVGSVGGTVGGLLGDVENLGGI